MPKRTIDPKEACVLLMEDNIRNLMTLTRLLSCLGIRRYEWKTTGWGVREFTEIMPKVDLILLHLELPYEDSSETVAKFRDNPKLKHTYIVAVTDDRQSSTLNKAKAAGFDGFINQFAEPAVFVQQMTDILQGKIVW